jgi:hypothetical protein
MILKPFLERLFFLPLNYFCIPKLKFISRLLFCKSTRLSIYPTRLILVFKKNEPLGLGTNFVL